MLSIIKERMKGIIIWLGFLNYCRKNKCIEKGRYQLYKSNRRYYLVNVLFAGRIFDLLDISNGHKVGFVHLINYTPLADLVGQAVMITASGYKIFNYEKGEVYTLELSNNTAVSLENAIRRLSPFFRLTYKTILTNASVERLVVGASRKTWDNEMIVYNYFHLCRCFIFYLNNRDHQFDGNFNVSQTDNHVKWEIIPKSAKDTIIKLRENIEDEVFRTVFQHGDLHFGNTLFDKDGFWLLDLEDARDDIFFYDLFTPIFVELTDWNNMTLFDLLFNKDARLISYLKQVFAAVGLVFNEKKIRDYFIVYLYARILFQVKKKQLLYNGSTYRKKLQASVNNVRIAMNLIGVM